MTTFPDNLFQLLSRTAEQCPAGNGASIYGLGRTEVAPISISYKQLLETSLRLGTSIEAVPNSDTGSIVLIHLDNHLDNIQWLWATIAAGRVPAMSTPFTNDLKQRRKHLEHLQTVLNNPVVLTQKSLEHDFLDIPGLTIYTIENLTAILEPGAVLDGASLGGAKSSQDIAALMLTSGSTGNAKAVTLRHGQIMHAVKGKSEFHHTATDSIFLNWIGMDHVANLTEIHLHAMWLGAQQIHVQAADVIADPLTFLELVDRHRVVYSFAPNFFLAKVQRALETTKNAKKHDLSTLKALISGGEANSTALCAELTKSLCAFGAQSGFIRPGFGMTETCAGSIYNNECPSIDLEHDREYTSLGHCIPGMEMRVTGSNGQVCGPMEVGNLQVRGVNVFTEYLNNPKATSDSIGADGWFTTGDRAFLDDKSRLNMVGREKESLNINGVKYYPHEIEGAIEDALLPGVTPSFTAVFPYRLPNAATETFCLVYLPTYSADDLEARASTLAELRTVVMNHCMSRPYKIIPMQREFLPKSALGKLSRAKLKTAFESGAYNAFMEMDEQLLAQYLGGEQIQPATETEKTIQTIFCDIFEITPSQLGTTANIFDMGCSSLEIFQIKSQLQKTEGLPSNIAITTIISNPTIQALAAALDNTKKPYSPVITLRSGGSKTPLWLIHPGVGEVLVFLNLARLITDRPVYALRARGFDGEPFFSSFEEVVTTYREAIQATQPDGPYAIAGYSYGGSVGFEVSKLLQKDGFEVPFLAVFDQPPHIKERMRHGGWADVLMTLVRFFDLLPNKETEQAVAARLKDAATTDMEEILDEVLSQTPVDRLVQFGLDKTRLKTWTSLALNSHTIAVDYEPSGRVSSLEVLYGQPIEAVAKTKDEWRNGKLSKWTDFADEVVLHEVAGHHYTLLAPENVASFTNTLKSRMEARGV